MKSSYTVQPYGSRIWFVSTRDEYNAVANQTLAEDAYYSGATDAHRTLDSVYVVGIFDGELLTLVHEAVHAASCLLDNCGIDPQSNNAEPLAYLVDHLVKVGARRLGLSHKATSPGKCAPH